MPDDMSMGEPQTNSPADRSPTETGDVVYVPSTTAPAKESTLPAKEGSVPPRKQRLRLPILLFIATCLSCWFVGSLRNSSAYAPGSEDRLAYYVPDDQLGSLGGDGIPLMLLRQSIAPNWQSGLVYMSCVMGILLAHEMGHFIAARIHGVPSSLPYFLPMPLSPIGTMGAVISMSSQSANRKEIFDIGLAGPIAGLIAMIPIALIGVMQFGSPETGEQLGFIRFPLGLQWAVKAFHPEASVTASYSMESLNPYLLATWVGMLITGLNMLPVSQLDGGHVLYALFGKKAHLMARGFMVLVFAYLTYTGSFDFIVMAVLVMIIGTDHPPTADDTVPLGAFRWCLGLLCLLIPLFAFTPHPIALGLGR